MKNLKNWCFGIVSLLSLACTLALLHGFDGLVARLGGQYQNTAFSLAIFYFVSAMATYVLLPVGIAKAQYAVDYKTAFLFTVKRYGFTYITLPFFVMRFGSVNAWLPYIAEKQLGNPLYHQTVWNECAEWTGLLMVLTIIFWCCLLLLNLFGMLSYGYIAVNAASGLCLLPLLYLTLDYLWVNAAQNMVLSALVLLAGTVAVIAVLRSGKQKTPPLRPFFAQAEEDDLFWRKKRDNERKWRSFK